ncbi:MAG: ribbon-helix-helix domain-containing protein [Campylobacterota bacterium]|nr:ribbon-helix-helix domain-containing protein [Campylobacterota bacterium]
MHTVTLKADDDFFAKLTLLAKELHLSKSELIRRSVAKYEESIYKQKIKEQMKMASMLTREESLRIALEFDDTVNDGLNDA